MFLTVHCTINMETSYHAYFWHNKRVIFSVLQCELLGAFIKPMLLLVVGLCICLRVVIECLRSHSNANANA